MSIGDMAGAYDKVVAPDHRERFSGTFLGSLLGQSVVLLVAVSLYMATLALLYRFFRGDFAGLREDVGALPFWAFILAPAAVIAVFSLLPTLAQARRLHRLRRLSIAQAERKPGVFRLAPNGAAEAEAYTRPDGADVAAIAWLRGSARTLLYPSCVFRSDYRELLFKHGLPASVAGENAFELPPFLRAEAEAFCAGRTGAVARGLRGPLRRSRPGRGYPTSIASFIGGVAALPTWSLSPAPALQTCRRSRACPSPGRRHTTPGSRISRRCRVLTRR